MYASYIGLSCMRQNTVTLMGSTIIAALFGSIQSKL
jgi:hypothetical protein